MSIHGAQQTIPCLYIHVVKAHIIGVPHKASLTLWDKNSVEGVQKCHEFLGVPWATVCCIHVVILYLLLHPGVKSGHERCLVKHHMLMEVGTTTEPFSLYNCCSHEYVCY